MKTKKTVIIVASIVILFANCRLPDSLTKYDYNSQNANANKQRVKSDYELQQEKEAARNKWIKENTGSLSEVPKTAKITKAPYIKGLTVGFTKDEKDKEYVQTDRMIPTDSFAHTDEEAKTIFLFNEKKRFFNNYKVTGRSGFVPSYIHSTEVIIIDRTIPAVIYRKTFTGKAPATNVLLKETDDEISGELPDSQISEFIRKLPRQ